MRTIAIGLLLLGAVMAKGIANADSDDTKWIARCLKDNANSGVSVEILTKYCTCMNNKMDNNETLSISAWEKTHPDEEAECDKESGWK